MALETFPSSIVTHLSLCIFDYLVKRPYYI